ncbi:kinetochore-associated protein KNL-2 homolog isoform X3 [Jatropha curcas]|uniref:kinetochore-associated protein KNL-2 homolog isoform X3 n=1 Tax=Jatropha curcas TaxID=180498 RepID=UPI001893C50A|nr:kinetochore-associated protein KNL-2 homolog isoform X3 [Jatropha curcas]
MDPIATPTRTTSPFLIFEKQLKTVFSLLSQFNSFLLFQSKFAYSLNFSEEKVTLRDWWLIKPDDDFEGKRLAVAGSAYGKEKAGRVFRTAPITKRYDVSTLETADGIVVILQGFINRPRTIENGFPSEVFKYFLFGFPPHWEEYAENCFEEAVNCGVTDPKKVTSISSPSKCSDIREDEYHIKVTEENSSGVSEKFAADASKAGPKENIVDNVECDASKNLSPSSCCLIDDASLMKDNVTEARSPSFHTVESSKKRDDLESGKKCKHSFIRKSKNSVSATLESIILENDESKECQVSNSAYMNNLGVSSFDKTVTIGAEGVVLAVSNKPKSKKKKENQNERTKYRLRSAMRNISIDSLPQGHEAISGLVNDEVICQELFASPTIGDSSILNQPSCNPEDATMFSAVQTVAVLDDFTPPMIESELVVAIPITSSHPQCIRGLADLKDNQKQKAVPGCSMKHKNKEVMSEVEDLDGKKLEKCSHPTLQAEEARPNETPKALGRFRNLSKNSRMKEKNEQISTKEEGSTMKKARRKITFDRLVSPLTRKSKEKTCILSPEYLNLKRSRSGRLLLPSLDFWRNQIPIYDSGVNLSLTRSKREGNSPSSIDKNEHRDMHGCHTSGHSRMKFIMKKGR